MKPLLLFIVIPCLGMDTPHKEMPVKIPVHSSEHMHIDIESRGNREHESYPNITFSNPDAKEPAEPQGCCCSEKVKLALIASLIAVISSGITAAVAFGTQAQKTC